ncbi:MAG: hypothetical protein RBT49_03795 [Bacteroidales bacterium]|jgi:asparagine synthase (glutamine-hydrolysing)|nr:hypothetical protein [Bacteroidales bacterium]
MGAFLLFKENNIEIRKIEETYSSSIEVFKNKQLPLVKRFVSDNFILFLFGKQKVDVDNYLKIGDGFIAGTGTYIYKNNTGAKALNDIYSDFNVSVDFPDSIRGNYAIILFKENRLFLFNDYQGLYNIFTNKSQSIFSSSILAIAKSMDKLSISKQEFYEYVLTGASYGDKTVFEEIDLVNSRVVHQISPQKKTTIRKNIFQERFSTLSNLPLDNLLEKVSAELVNYFDEVKSAFGNDIITPITGGFDSRLIYAVMNNTGIIPHSAFVLKKDYQKDVEIAQEIADHYKVPLLKLSNDFPNFKEDKSLETLKTQYYLYDGLGIGGVFQYFSGLDVWARLPYRKLLLDGGGGEIYRNMHRLPNRSMMTRKYIERVLNKGDIRICGESFNSEEYTNNLENKIMQALSVNRKSLSRIETERIFPEFYLKYWMGSINSLANQFSYYLTPFSDECIAAQSNKLPYNYKLSGYFEAKLIKFLSPELAKFQSNYGVNFYDGFTLRNQFVELMKIYTATQLKKNLKRLLPRKNKKVNLPFYGQQSYVQESLKLDEYVKELLCKSDLEVSKYIDFSKAVQPAAVSRALSVELIMSRKF